MAEFRFEGGVVAPANCADASPTGQLSYVYDYVVKKIQNSGFHDQTCTPWLHGNVKFENMQINQDITTVVNITASGNISAALGTVSGNVGSFGTKNFNIAHPTKDGKRLIYGCLEGPENGVYIRGRLTKSNVIQLPDYWVGLVDLESITVTLTQIGYSQDLIVDTIQWGQKVIVKSNNGTTIDCYYTINATRKDVPPLEVEVDS